MSQTPPPQPPRRRIPALDDGWNRFIAFCLLVMLFPFIPIGAEFVILGAVSEQSATLFASMYALSIGVISRSLSLFSLAVFISVAFAIVFGAVMFAERNAGENRAKYIAEQKMMASPSLDLLDKKEAIPYLRETAAVAIFVVFLLHILERYNRHVVDLHPAFEFET